MSVNSNFSKLKVDAASAFTAVCAYHPLRTAATRMMGDMPFTMNPKHLYGGFVPSAFSAHQLFVIPIAYNEMRSKDGDTFAAIAAGVISTPSTTFCEATAVRRQKNIRLASNSAAMVMRGFVPMVFRQIGISLGIFVFPKWLERTFAPIEKTSKEAYAFLGGVMGALITHYPDGVRVKMQTQQELTIKEAGHLAWKDMMSRAGAKSCFIRVGVLAVAFKTLRWGKKNFPTMFNKQEN